MSTPPVIDGPASVTPADTIYPADDGCRISETREWIWDADQWEFTDSEQSEGQTARTFSHCRAVTSDTGVYPLTVPTTIPDATTTTYTTIPASTVPSTIPVTGSDSTPGALGIGVILFVGGMLAVLASRRRNTEDVAE